LPDESEEAYLQARISEAKSRERMMNIFSFFGIAGIVIGLYEWFLDLIVVGAVLVVFGFVMSLRYYSQKKKYVEQLKDVGLKKKSTRARRDS
jgi:hypothetical protein